MLGTRLLERRALTREALDRALSEQKSGGGRLGDVLVAHGHVSPLTLHGALAEARGMPFLDLTAAPPEDALLQADHLEEYIYLQTLPWRCENSITTLVTAEPDATMERWANAHYGTQWNMAVTSPYDIRRTIEQRFAEHLTEESRLALYRLAPHYSARHTFTASQRHVLLMTLLVGGGALATASQITTLVLLGGLQILYATALLFKVLLFMAGRKPKPQTLTPAAQANLPVYTILVPLYREANILPRLLENLRALDYPPAKLDIKLVMEADDFETLVAAREAKPAWNIEILRVPPSEPRTKPKALNYALHFARGDYVTIFDAEDLPHPQQLKLAAQTMREHPDMGCLQARLNWYNADDNMLTRWFALEYAILFERLLPGLETLRMPIPLGGTSNHLSLANLREAGAWDPFNVTEDADLGLRLAAAGKRTGMLDSLTLEEAPNQIMPWIRQRSRWVKGYMQTYLVQMRRPSALLKAHGLRGFTGIQCFVGLPAIIFLTAPLVWAATYVVGSGIAQVPLWLLYPALLNLWLHFTVHWVQAFAVVKRLPGYSAHSCARFHLAAALYPFYWVLHSIASYRALWQLLTRPFYWEKTEHGLTYPPERGKSRVPA